MKKVIVYIALSMMVLTLLGCGGTESGHETPLENNDTSGTDTGTQDGLSVTVRVIDGYNVINSQVSDSNGQVAEYQYGRYIFNNSVVYPLHVSGGDNGYSYSDSMIPLDINMSTTQGTLISPITTFIGSDTNLLTKLSQLNLPGNPSTLEDFSVNYIMDDNIGLLELAEILYAVERSSALTTKVKQSLQTQTPQNLNQFIDLIDAQVDTTTGAYATTFHNYFTYVKSLYEANPLSSSQTTQYELMRYLHNFKSALNDTLTPVVFHGKTYGKVESPYTGRIWLDRNIGAIQVCRDTDDADCFGDYYQWGRAADGHEKITSNTDTTLAASVTNVGSDFIITSDNANSYDWASVDNDGETRREFWTLTDGSSVCPVGYQIPTYLELGSDVHLGGDDTNIEAFNNFLKLPKSSHRRGDDGSFNHPNSQDDWSGLWSSDVGGGGNNYSYIVWWTIWHAGGKVVNRSSAFNLRCIKK